MRKNIPLYFRLARPSFFCICLSCAWSTSLNAWDERFDDSMEAYWKFAHPEKPDNKPEYYDWVKWPVTRFGGDFEGRFQERRDVELKNADDDRSSYRHQLQVQADYLPTDAFAIHGEITLSQERAIKNQKPETNRSVERGETWLDFHRKNRQTGIRIGRQSFSDKREWWWDADLDAVRLYHSTPTIQYELSVAQELGGTATNKPLDAEKEDIQRLLGRIRWKYRKDHRMDLFVLDHKDKSDTPAKGAILATDKEDESDADLLWYGMQISGKHKIKKIGKIRYWGNVAAVTGIETLIDFDDINQNQIEVDDLLEQDVDGSAFDTGVSLRTKLPGQPSITLGYAQGSGDGNPNDNTDHSFRHNDLSDNSGKFNGVNSFRYYGEHLRPQLSNLQVSTLSFGYPINKGKLESSIELVYHQYRQQYANTDLDSQLRVKPSGLSRDIGEEIDLVIGMEKQNLELELTTSIFKAGKAFDNQQKDRSVYIGSQLNYKF